MDPGKAGGKRDEFDGRGGGDASRKSAFGIEQKIVVVAGGGGGGGWQKRVPCDIANPPTCWVG
jgi:hypothetical protein